jgi:hypothetical protein
MKKWICFSLLLLTLFSLGLSACNLDTLKTQTETSTSIATSTTTSVTLFTQWESKKLASDMAFENSIDGTINGKNYLICNAIYGASTNQENMYVTIVILDITNPDNPDEISSLQTGQDSPPFVCNLILNGAILYALTEDNLWIIDVSNPNQPKNVGRMSLTSTDARNIEVSGKYAYILSTSETNAQIITTVDISDPIHPVSVGQLTIPGTSLVYMEASDSLLLALAYDGLYIYDISTPVSLKQIGFLADPFPPITSAAPEFIPTDFFDMALHGNDLYITAGINQLLVVDISNPSGPKIINDFETGEQGTEIIIFGEKAYLFSSSGAIQFSEGINSLLAIVDISDPGNLKELNYASLPASSNGPDSEYYHIMFEASNHLYFCDELAPIFQIINLTKSP